MLTNDRWIEIDSPDVKLPMGLGTISKSYWVFPLLLTPAWFAFLLASIHNLRGVTMLYFEGVALPALLFTIAKASIIIP